MRTGRYDGSPRDYYFQRLSVAIDAIESKALRYRFGVAGPSLSALANRSRIYRRRFDDEGRLVVVKRLFGNRGGRR